MDTSNKDRRDTSDGIEKESEASAKREGTDVGQNRANIRREKAAAHKVSSQKKKVNLSFRQYCYYLKRFKQANGHANPMYRSTVKVKDGDDICIGRWASKMRQGYKKFIETGKSGTGSYRVTKYEVDVLRVRLILKYSLTFLMFIQSTNYNFNLFVASIAIPLGNWFGIKIHA